jgi:chemotaxis signal transduction protein
VKPGAAASADTLDALRREFDDAFARAPAPAGAAPQPMLAIRVGEHPYALRLAQIAGLHADRHVTALPSALPALLGVSGFRGQIAPVYDLAVLLGYPAAAAPRWLVLVRGAQPLALAFERFDCHFLAAPEQVLAAAGAEGRDCVRGAVAQGGEAGARALIELPALLDEIRRQADLALRQRSLSS